MTAIYDADIHYEHKGYLQTQQPILWIARITPQNINTVTREYLTGNPLTDIAITLEAIDSRLTNNKPCIIHMSHSLREHFSPHWEFQARYTSK